MHTCKGKKCTLKPARDCMLYAEIPSILLEQTSGVPLPSKQPLLPVQGSAQQQHGPSEGCQGGRSQCFVLFSFLLLCPCCFLL